jgi:hypothetical protein
MTIEYWKEVNKRLKKLQQIDRGHELVFGSKGHKYKPHGPVSEKEIDAFEKANNVYLPEEYRDFLLTIGGGPGPDYGIYSFHTIDAPKVSEKFFLTESTEWPDDDNHPIWDLPGLINISTSGCAIDWFLEVKGPQPGTMWVDSGPGWELSKQDLFINWYSKWLDRIESGLLRYVILKTMVHSKSSIHEIEQELEMESREFRWDGFEYRRFEGVPGRITCDGGRAVSLDIGPCWIN